MKIKLHINNKGRLVYLLPPLKSSNQTFYFDVVGIKAKNNNINSPFKYILE